MTRERRHLNWDGRSEVIAFDDRGSEPRLILGPKRFTLRAYNSRLWISVDINRMDIANRNLASTFTDDRGKALAFGTVFEAVQFWRHVNPTFFDQHGHVERPLAALNLIIEEVSG